MGLLDGKVVVVTGGGHGIGRAYCMGIAREGGAAVVADIDDKAADGVAKAIADKGGKALAIKVDVATFPSCQEMAAKALGAYGQIDGLINNAQTFRPLSPIALIQAPPVVRTDRPWAGGRSPAEPSAKYW